MNIIWTNQALHEYDEAIADLLENWSEKIAQRLIIEVRVTIERVIDHPNMFKNCATFQYVRKAKVNRFKSIVYHVDENDLVILRLLDNRTDHIY